MSDNYKKLIDKLARSKPILQDPEMITSDIIEKINKENGKSGNYFQMSSFAKVAAVIIILLSAGLLMMQEWQAYNNLLSMEEGGQEVPNHYQPTGETIDCKQLIKSSLRAVMPDVQIRVNRSERIVEFEGENERIAQIENYLNSELNLSNDGRYYLTENDIKAFGITCNLF